MTESKSGPSDGSALAGRLTALREALAEYDRAVSGGYCLQKGRDIDLADAARKLLADPGVGLPAQLSSEVQETKDDPARVGPSVPCVETAGSTAERPTGEVTAERRPCLGSRVSPRWLKHGLEHPDSHYHRLLSVEQRYAAGATEFSRTEIEAVMEDRDDWRALADDLGSDLDRADSLPLPAVAGLRALVDEWLARADDTSIECPDCELVLRRCADELADLLAPLQTEDETKEVARRGKQAEASGNPPQPPSGDRSTDPA